MASENIEQFNECVAHIFGKLYQSFPIPLDVHYNIEAHELWQESGDADMDLNQQLFLKETVDWLEQAGYIWRESGLEASSYRVVLSAKGLEVLKVIPASLQATAEPVGESLLHALKDGAMGVAKEAVKIALTEGFKLVIGRI